MADNPSTSTIINGSGAEIPVATVVDGLGTTIPQTVPRVGGAPVGPSNPMPSQDTNSASALAQQTAAAAALGAPGDGVYAGTGPASVVGVLKGVWAVLSGTLKAAQPDVRQTAQTLALNTLNNAFTVALANGASSIAFKVTGLTASGGAVLTAQISNDNGANWDPKPVESSGVLTSTLSADGPFRANIAAHTNFRLLVTTPGTGSATLSYSASVATGLVADVGAVTALGTTADASWGGTGNASITSVLKGIWTALAGTLKTQAFTTPSPLTNSAITATSSTAGQSSIIVPYSSSRKFVHVFSRTTGTETVDLGSQNVAQGGGIPISGGGGFTFIGAGAAGPIYAITTVASSPISYVEG